MSDISHSASDRSDDERGPRGRVRNAAAADKRARTPTRGTGIGGLVTAVRKRVASSLGLGSTHNILPFMLNLDGQGSLVLLDYFFDAEGRLRQVSNPAKGFEWRGQENYDKVGFEVECYIQYLMGRHFRMDQLWFPLGPKGQQAEATEPRVNIFTSDNIAVNEGTCAIVIQGSGAVRAGQWARSVCINDSLGNGTVLPYLDEFTKRGWSYVVLNPNLNSVTVDGVPLPIPGNDCFEAHVQYAYEELLTEIPAKSLVIVAHSFGGHATLELLNACHDSIEPRLRGIAFTDSVHFTRYVDEEKALLLLRARSRNWVASTKPVNAYERFSSECWCVSSGHTEHVYTSASAKKAVFEYLDQCTSMDMTESLNVPSTVPESIHAPALRVKGQLVGDRCDVVALKAQYSASASFCKKLDDLTPPYDQVRPFGEDGNHMIRGFGFGLLREVARDPAYAEFVSGVLSSSVEYLNQAGFEHVVVEGLVEDLQEQVADFAPLHKSELVLVEATAAQVLSATEKWQPVVQALRFLASAYMRHNRDLFISKIPPSTSLDECLENFVERPASEGGPLALEALSLYFKLPFNVHVLDWKRRAGENVSAMGSENGPPKLAFLLRPGSIDLLYPDPNPDVMSPEEMA